MEVEQLLTALEHSWDATSSYFSEWSKDNPARGQCAVTSLVAQDYLGGDIVRFIVEFNGKQEKHYVNLVNDELIDLTMSQFPDNAIFKPSVLNVKPFDSVREKLLSNKDTATRYNHLKSEVEVYLANKSG
jgi:hypothetical protein